MSDERSQIIQEVVRAARGGAPVAVATVIRGPQASRPAVGEKLLVRADGSRLGSLAGGELEEAIAADSHAALTRLPRKQVESLFYRADGTRLHRLEAGANEFEVMIEVAERPATLLIVGGGHIGQSLAAMASQVGFSVAVLDDRAAFANIERFPTADQVICGDFVEELRRFSIDAHTYIVLVSRGHKQDELSLREVATSEAAYVGMIGSRRRVGAVLTHLTREGLPQEALARVHTPIGLDIGAETPEEIAVSIIAQIISVRRGGSGAAMSELRRPKIRE
ncbi:MAG: XdhC family protein [Chloroflexi bacterium]|nr:XdhC family protein [Chloroflexota bacterium]